MNKLIKNYFYNMLYQILAIIIPIITTPYLSRILGAEGVGIYAYVISITTYFILFGTLGISIYGQREIAYLQDDIYKRSLKFWELFFIKTFSMLIGLIVYLIILRKNVYFNYFKILTIQLIAVVIDINWFYQGMEEFKKVAFRNILVKLLSLISIFIFVKTSEDVNKYIYIYSLSIFFGNITLWIGLRKKIVLVKLRDLNLLPNLKPAVYFLIPQIANTLYTVIDKTMLGTMLNDISETGIYEQAEKIIKIWITIITALGTVIMPRIAYYYSKKQKEKIEKVMNKTIEYVFFCSFPLIFGIISVATDIIPIYLGAGFEKCIFLVKLFSPIILIIGLNNIIGNQYLLPTNQQKKYVKAVVSGTIVNFAINYILIPIIGCVGAVIASIISEIVVLIIELFYLRKEFEIVAWMKKTYNYLVSSIIMFIVCIIIRYINLIPILSIILQIIIGGCVYFVSLFVLKDKFFCEILGRIFTKINTENRRKLT